MRTTFLTPRRSVATEANPYARTMDFILTDFLPNANRQAIAPEEAERIIQSAKGMPIKYEPVREGHAGAFPIGVIEQVWSGIDPVTNQPCLYARAVLWESEYPDIVQQLREEFEQTGSLAVSWELVFDRSDVRDGVEWLYGVTVVGAAIVEQPAYGKTRTRVLRVAETDSVGGIMDDVQRELEALRAEREQYRARVEQAEKRAEQAEMELRVYRRAQVLAAVVPASLLEQHEPLLRTLTDEQFAVYSDALHAVAEYYRGERRGDGQHTGDAQHVGDEQRTTEVQRTGDAQRVEEEQHEDVPADRAAASVDVRRRDDVLRGYPRSAQSAYDPVDVLLNVLCKR